MSRVVFYCHDEPGNLGVFEYYQQDIQALEALGHDVCVCTEYREIPSRFDVMFVWWWTHALWPVLLARTRGKACIVTGVYNLRLPPTFAGADYFHRPAWQRAMIALATKWCSLNLFIDGTELTGCADAFGIDNGRIYPCSVHEDYLHGPGPEREVALFNLAWSGKRNLVRKGIPELLDAVRLLRDTGTLVRVFLAGPVGDGKEELLARIRELGLTDQVTWLGALSRADKIGLLRSCELYVQPSHHEGFGLAMAEAMGCGACVITCEVGAVRSVVGDCGIYVQPGSPEALAEGIARGLTDVPLRRRLQAAGHERARMEFAPDKKRARLKAYLAELGISST